jgi:hypothetical protein
VLVRHGETEWSLSGQHTGSTEIPLTEKGRAQGASLAERLRDENFGTVLTSPLSRARDTCKLAGFDDRAEVLDDLREWEYGVYEGRTTKDIRVELPGWTVWDGPVPDGETVEDVGVRADRVVERLLARTAALRSSRTGTSCGSSRRAGSGCRRGPASCSRSRPRRSPCSASSGRRGCSSTGTTTVTCTEPVTPQGCRRGDAVVALRGRPGE